MVPRIYAYALEVSSVVGRDAEIAAVEAFLSAHGLTRVLAIVGEPGIGKTTVWDAAVREAREGGSTVLIARPAESEARLSFAGLADLLAHLPDVALAGLPAPQREALDVALLRIASSRPPERRLVGAALLSVLRGLAANAPPVVVAVDDLQWLDAPSAAAIEFALRRIEGEAVLGIVSARSEEVEQSLMAAAARDGTLELLELGPLSVAALHRIVTDSLGRSFPRPTLVRIARTSGGNPLYALEIARLLDRDEGSRDAAGLPVPDSLRSLMAGRIGVLPSKTREALLRASALARPDLRLVDAQALAPAEEAALVRIRDDARVEFVHPLYASAVYSSASLERRRAAHRALAEAVEDPEERARHLALASDGPDERVAREVEEAARHARMRGAPDSAAELTELALELVPAGSTRRDELRLDLAEHLYLASDFERSGEVLEALNDELGEGDLRARVLLGLAEIDYWRKGESAAVGLAEEAVRCASDPLVLARSHAAVAMYAGTVELAKASNAARAALSVLDQLPNADPSLVATALGARVRADLFLGEGFDAQAAERARALEASRAPPATVDTRIVFKLGQWLRYVDDLDGARACLAAAEQAARDEGDESSLANILLNRVVAETWAGAWDDAARLTQEMSDAFEQLGVGPEGIDPWRAFVDAHRGRLDAVREAVGDSPPSEPIIAMIRLRCLGLAELANGETEAANVHLSEAMETLERVDFREPAIWRVDGDAIEAALGVGELERAERLVGSFETRAQSSRIPWSLAVSARCRGLLDAAAGGLEAGARSLERALAEHESSPVPFERARTLLAQGQVRRRLKQKRAARESLDAAAVAFRRLGAEAWIERTAAELRRVAVRQAPRDLSETELRIARLAADGLTNQQIANEVFLTRKTVEANLARAYRKLGIRSRAQLSRALDARESDRTPAR